MYVCACVYVGERWNGETGARVLGCRMLQKFCLYVASWVSVCVCVCFVCLEVVEGGSGCVIYGSGKTQSVTWASCSS